MNETNKTKQPELNIDEFLIQGKHRPLECTQCGGVFEVFVADDAGDAGAPDFCLDCRRIFPESLLKATIDPFDYALRLRTGELLYFTEATIHGKWVHLKFATPKNGDRPRACLFPHGVDIRLSDIVWCADAPDGS